VVLFLGGVVGFGFCGCAHINVKCNNEQVQKERVQPRKLALPPRDFGTNV